MKEEERPVRSLNDAQIKNLLAAAESYPPIQIRILLGLGTVQLSKTFSKLAHRNGLKFGTYFRPDIVWIETLSKEELAEHMSETDERQLRQNLAHTAAFNNGNIECIGFPPHMNFSNRYDVNVIIAVTYGKGLAAYCSTIVDPASQPSLIRGTSKIRTSG